MLPEERRNQLDGIVSQMVANNEDDNAIDFVVNDFKNKYSVKAPEKTFLEKTSGVLDMLFGGGKIGEAIGTKLAESSTGAKALKAQEEQGLIPKGTYAESFKQPTAGEVAGSAIQSGALFIPGGKLASLGTKVATKAGLKVGASAVGKIGTGLAAGEIFDVASNLQQGKTGTEALTPGLGTLLGGGIPAAGVAKNVMVRFGDKQAPRIINSLIKPLAKDFSYGKNPGRAIAESGIVANNFDDLITKIRATRQTTGQAIGELSDKLSTTPILNIQNSLSFIDDAAKSAASQNNSSLLKRLNDVKRSLSEVLEPYIDETGNIGIKSIGSKNLDNLTFKEARNILSDIGDITAFTGNPSDDKIVNGALKKVYGSIKESTLKAADDINPVIAKEFRKLTEKYADLSSAEIATKYRDKIVERSNLIGLSPQTVGIGTGLITAVATGGATIPAIVVGISGATIDKLLSTPAFKTRLAYILSTKTQGEVNFLLRKIPALKRVFNTKSGITPGDVILNKAQATPNKQGGFIKVGKEVSQPKVESSLAQEAKKYKSAEEFVKSQGTPIYHGSNEKIKIFSNKKGAQGVIWFTDNPKAITAGESGAQGIKYINERITTGQKFAGWDEYEKFGLGQIKDMGFDGIKLPTTMNDGTKYNDYILFDNKTIKTKSQLTDIWNKANNK